MKKILFSTFALLGFSAVFFLTTADNVSAHPGGLDSSGGHYCWTNCSYWGETYGVWHSHRGGSSYSSYTPSYSSYTSTYKTNSDCPSYGFAYMGSCYELPAHAKKSYLSGFTCDYGYEEVGYGLSKQCLAKITNGYRIGSSVFCNYGYQLSYNQCVKKGSSSYSYGFADLSDYDFSFDYGNSCPKNSSVDPDDSDMCICDLGYEPNKDKDACKKTSKKTNDKLCKVDFGKNSIWTGKYDKQEEVPTCKCKSGYEWNTKMTSCVKEKK